MLSRFSLLLLFVIVVLVRNISAQVPGFGSCPQVNVISDFDAERYLGTWYEVKKYPFIFTIGGKCITAEYDKNPNGTVSVLNKQVRGGSEETIRGNARLNDPTTGVLSVTFSGIPFQTESNYLILDTDYESFAVVFSCSSFLHLVNGKIVWILSRSRFPPQSVLDRAYDIMKINGLSTTYLATTDNTGCPDEIPNGIDSFRY